MSANDNLDSLTSRARSQRDDTEHDEGAQRRQDPQPRPLPLPTAAPTHHSPTLLPDNYLQARQGNFYDNQSPTPVFPASLLTPAPSFPAPNAALAAPNSPALAPAPAVALNQYQISAPTNPTNSSQPIPVAPQSGSFYEESNATPANAPTLASASPTPNPNQNPAPAQALDPNSAPPTPYIQDRRPVNLPMDSTVQMPGRSRDDIPIDCTVQMRGRPRNIQVESGIPWEKSQEPAEEEEKILALPVPPPPPSSTNNRLPAMQPMITNEMLQNHVEQAASGNFNAAKLDAIPTPRQAVRYKPASPTSDSVARPKMVDPVTPKKRKSASEESYQDRVPQQKRQHDQEDQNNQPVESKRVRINPKLLKPADSASSAGSSDSEYDTEFTPRRYSSLASDGSVSKFSWSEMQYLLKFYFREVKSLLINPHDFFLAHMEDTTLGEPITFMILSGGIAAVFMTLSGNIGDAISTLFGTSAYAIIAGIAVHYAMQWMGVSEGELKSCFKILAYSQAPLLVSWIKLGTIPVGWFLAFAYSMYLCVIGMEQVFEMDRQRAIVIVAVVSIVIRGLLHLVGL